MMNKLYKQIQKRNQKRNYFSVCLYFKIKVKLIMSNKMRNKKTINC